MVKIGCIITDDKELEPGMKVVLVKKDNRKDRQPAVVGRDKRIVAGGASMNLSGIEKIGCHLAVES